MRSAFPWFVLAAALAVLDQLTKWIVLGAFRPGESLALTGFFNLVLTFNRGAAFSMFAGASGWQTPVFAVVALTAAVVLSVLLVRNPGKRLFCAGLALILGGAVGNLIDRIRLGAVVDFLDFHAFGMHFPAFNVADSAITVGALLLILDSFAHPEPAAR